MSQQPLIERISNRMLYSSHPFVMVNCFVIMIFLIIRIVELWGVSHAVPAESSMVGIILHAIVIDLLFWGSVMGLLSLFYFVSAKVLGNKTALYLHIGMLLLLLFLTMALTKYFLITLLPLSADFYGYSWNDINETVRTSGGIGPVLIPVVIVIAALVFSLPVIALKFPSPKFFVMGFYSISFVSIPLLFIVQPSPSNFATEIEYNIVENKTFHFARQSVLYFSRKLTGGTGYSESEYPFLRPADYSDHLGKYFSVGTEKPNIVIIIVEGLGSSFVNGGQYQGFTPFIDSLSRQGLFWKNFLSTTGRTFGVLPSLLASAPFSEKGFMELGSKMPDHRSLVTLLQQNGYRSSFYYGGKIDFDNQNVFLERQEIRNIIDEGDFLPPFERSPANDGGFSWGYADDDLFKRSLLDINEHNFSPRLDLYLTISTHEPFNPPKAEQYRQLFEQTLSSLNADESKRAKYKRYSEVYSTLLYTDNALRNFIEAYRKRKDFKKTIFIITGDHRLIPVPMDTKIDRYRVPLIIYSPMITEPTEFHSVSTHADLVPTLLGFLKQNYAMKFPADAHWVGTMMDTAKEFRNRRSAAFMPYKGEISDYLDGKYFLSGERLFEVYDGLYIEEINDEGIRQQLTAKRNLFAEQCSYACSMNKIYPTEHLKHFALVSENEDSLFAQVDRLGLNSDQLFFVARDTAFKGYYREARGICRRLLAINPDYHDVRTLLGRAFAWEHQYVEASEEFMEVIRRAPNYSDAYLGLGQVQYWSGNDEEAITSAARAIELLPDNIDARLLIATINFKKGDDASAERELLEIFKRSPNLGEAKALEEKISQTRNRR